MICESSDLCAAVDLFQVVPQRNGVPVTEFFRLRSGRGKLSIALGSEVFGEFLIDAKVDPASWEFFINRKLLRSFVSKTDGALKMTPDNPKTPTKLAMKLGRRTATFEAPEFIEGYGSNPQENSRKLELRQDQIEQIRLAALYTLADADAPAYSQIYLDSRSGAVVAANRLSYFSSLCGIRDDGAFPASFHKLLTLNAVLRISDKGVKLTYPDGYLYQCFSSGDFPLKQIRRIFEEAERWPTVLDMDAAEFRDAVRRLRVFDQTEGTLSVSKTAGEAEATLTVEGQNSRFTESIAARGRSFDEQFLIPSFVPLLEDAPPGARLLVSFEARSPYLFRLGNTFRGPRVISPRKKA